MAKSSRSFKHVALNVRTNYLNEALKAEVDFPVIKSRTAA